MFVFGLEFCLCVGCVLSCVLTRLCVSAEERVTQLGVMLLAMLLIFVRWEGSRHDNRQPEVGRRVAATIFGVIPVMSYDICI